MNLWSQALPEDFSVSWFIKTSSRPNTKKTKKMKAKTHLYWVSRFTKRLALSHSGFFILPSISLFGFRKICSTTRNETTKQPSLLLFLAEDSSALFVHKSDIFTLLGNLLNICIFILKKVSIRSIIESNYISKSFKTLKWNWENWRPSKKNILIIE